MFSAIVDCQSLSRHLDDAEWIVVDCRFNLMDPAAGRRAYLESHIRGAQYADLQHDLSGPPVTDQGRHPLPVPGALAETFSRFGIHAGKQVVAYDDAGGSVAARLWWLLHYMGHEAAAVLDGGWQAWQAEALPLGSGEQTREPARFTGKPAREWLVLAADVPDQALLVDSRDPARYRGELEPIDPVAGHIPGACNRFWKDNLQASGAFAPPAALRAAFGELLNGAESAQTTFYCGSGVTACHNLLALAHAGMPPAKLYAGSWSDWCADASRPVETGGG